MCEHGLGSPLTRERCGSGSGSSLGPVAALLGAAREGAHPADATRALGEGWTVDAGVAMIEQTGGGGVPGHGDLWKGDRHSVSHWLVSRVWICYARHVKGWKDVQLHGDTMGRTFFGTLGTIGTVTSGTVTGSFLGGVVQDGEMSIDDAVGADVAGRVQFGRISATEDAASARGSAVGTANGYSRILATGIGSRSRGSTFLTDDYSLAEILSENAASLAFGEATALGAPSYSRVWASQTSTAFGNVATDEDQAGSTIRSHITSLAFGTLANNAIVFAQSSSLAFGIGGDGKNAYYPTTILSNSGSLAFGQVVLDPLEASYVSPVISALNQSMAFGSVDIGYINANSAGLAFGTAVGYYSGIFANGGLAFGLASKYPGGGGAAHIRSAVGSMAFGHIDGDGYINSQGFASIAAGSIIGTGYYYVRTSPTSHGSLAMGDARDGSIYVDGNGCIAFGAPFGAGFIVATGVNTHQWGQGQNYVSNSSQFGEGIRIHHAIGVPLTVGNGSIYQNGGNVYIYSGGVARNMSTV